MRVERGIWNVRRDIPPWFSCAECFSTQLARDICKLISMKKRSHTLRHFSEDLRDPILRRAVIGTQISWNQIPNLERWRYREGGINQIRQADNNRAWCFQDNGLLGLKIRSNDFIAYYNMTIVVGSAWSKGNSARNGFYATILTNGGWTYISAEFRSIFDDTSC